MSRPPDALDTVQRWFQAVVTHPGGLEEGIGSAEAQRLIPLRPGELEQVVRRSRSLSAGERLSIYAGAYYARLLECLGECFPVLRRAVGEEVFESFAFEYLQRYPSRSYTLDRLGESFPRFLDETRPADNPAATWPGFLIDLARLEWALAKVFDGPGVEGQALLDGDALAAVPPERFAAARLEPVVCLRLLSFGHPVNAYYTAVRHAGEGEEIPIPDPAEEYVALTRRDFVVRRHPLTRPQYLLLTALQAGRQVGEAIAEAAAASDLDDLDDEALAGELRSWFRLWAAEGFFRSIYL